MGIIHRTQEVVVHDDDLNNIYIDCVHSNSITCPFCGQKAECNVDLFSVSKGNTMRAFFYDDKDAAVFAEAIERE